VKHKIKRLNFDTTIAGWTKKFLNSHRPEHNKSIRDSIDSRPNLDPDIKRRAIAKLHAEDAVAAELRAAGGEPDPAEVVAVLRRHDYTYQLGLPVCDICDAPLDFQKNKEICMISFSECDWCMCRACLAALPGRIDATTPTAY